MKMMVEVVMVIAVITLFVSGERPRFEKIIIMLHCGILHLHLVCYQDILLCINPSADYFPPKDGDTAVARVNLDSDPRL